MNTLPIELRSWRQFVAVAQHLHFGHAAKALNMTQPPLTQAIAKLEGVLGVRLFDRSKRRVQLTVAGTALLPEVVQLLERAQSLALLARAAAEGQRGRLRLAFVSTVGYGLLPQWVRAFRSSLPYLQLDLIEATGDVQLEAFARGDIDAGFVLHAPGFAPAGLDRLAVASEPMVLALPEQHPLAKRARAPSFDEVLDAALVVFPRKIAPSLFDAIEGLYRSAGRVPLIAQQANQMQTIVNLVSAGLGVAWVPQSVTQFQRPGVVYRSLRPGAAGTTRQASCILCETSLVWNPRALNPALGQFVTFATDRAQSSIC